jgi:hypothetical protein
MLWLGDASSAQEMEKKLGHPILSLTQTLAYVSQTIAPEGRGSGVNALWDFGSVLFREIPENMMRCHIRVTEINWQNKDGVLMSILRHILTLICFLSYVV